MKGGGRAGASRGLWRLDAEGFFLTKPLELRPWVNYLGNGSYGLRISHLGDAFATTLKEPRKVVTNYDFFAPLKGRFLYVREGETLWNPSFYPTKTPLQSYECNHGTGWTRFRSALAGLQVTSTHFVPRDGCFEIWLLEAVNHGKREARAALFPLVEFLLYDSFGIDPVYYSWYTDSKLLDDGRTLTISKTESSQGFGFFHSLRAPDYYEASLEEFRGNGDMQNPEAAGKGRLSSQPSAGDPYIGCFQFDVVLAPGKKWNNALFIGEGRANLTDVRGRFTTVEEAEEELRAVKEHWERKLFKPEFQRVKRKNLRDYLSTFFPYQIFQQSGGLVRSIYRGYRDVAQDAMGLSYFDPAAARSLILDLLDKQYAGGRCLRQWSTSGSFHDTRDFRDLPFWLPLAVAKYIEVSGDWTIVEEKKGFLDDERPVPLLEHVNRGLRYSLQFGPHELLMMGQGDWNDALSGLGPQGESLWLSQCAYLALDKLEWLTRKSGWESGLDIKGLRERLYAGTLAGWTGKWFLRGCHENGRVIGGQDRIFLLPQAWFVISGMSVRDPEKGRIALDSMIEKLDCEWGLLKCFPAFEEFDPQIGNLSALTPGMAENFAVYNHACAFAVYALLLADRVDDARRYIDKLLPISKDPLRTRAEPYVLVNFYNGGYYPQKAGHGGIPWLTSTVSWLAMALFDHVFPRDIAL
jgi:cellobiose phosphorylase